MAGRLLRLMLCLLVLVLVMPAGLKAATVGRFVQVEGQVDLLKGGQLPVTKAAVQQPVDQGDVVRTKASSRAQIQFVDETVLTIGPSSRVAIEDYVFDAAQGKRSATIEIFRGLVQTVVKKIYQMEEPDFVVKTHTSVLGVRGTKWYTQLLPTSTDVYTEEAGSVTKLGAQPSSKAGLEVKNIFPEIPGSVILKAMQFTRVAMDLPPTLPVNITQEDLKYLQTWMNIESGESSSSQSPPTGGLSTMPTDASTRGGSLVSPTYLPRTTALDSPTQYFASGFYVPPQPGSAPTPSPEPSPPGPPTPPAPPQPTTYYFTQSWFGTFVFQSDYPFTQGTVQGWGWGQRTGVYEGYYAANFTHTRLPAAEQIFGHSFLPGTSTGTMEGSVTGTLGQTLSGTMTFTGDLAIGGTFDYSGNVTLEPSGAMVFNYSGTRADAEGASLGTTTNGTMYLNPGTYFRQTVSGASFVQISSPPYFAAIARTDAPFSGTREGYNPGTFYGSFTNNLSTEMLNVYAPSESGTIDLTMEGVISGTSGETQTGAMTVTGESSLSPVPTVSGGPVTAYPDGTMVAELYASRNLGPGVFQKEQGIWVQTPDASAVPFTARFNGSTDAPVSDPPFSTATYNGRGYGFLGETEGLGGGYYAGTYSGTATGPDDTFSPPVYPGELFLNIAGIAREAEGSWTGVVFANGRFANSVWLYTDVNPGSFTIDETDSATINLNNLWREVHATGFTSGTVASTINTTPGAYFNQVAGPGSLTYISEAPYTQQVVDLTDGSPITNGTGTLGNFIVSGFSGTTTVESGDTNVFSPLVVRPNSMIYTQGVIGPGGVGAMQLTVVDGTGFYRARGGVVQTPGPSLQAINLVDNAYLGNNGVPVNRSLQYQQQPE